MDKHWIFYASVVTGITCILFYVACNYKVDVYLQLGASAVENSDLSHCKVLNVLSKQTVGRVAYEDSVGWMLHSDLEPENSITLQGYALGWNFWEQQTCAAKNLVGLQRWATSLDFAVVEPFVYQSFLKISQFDYNSALRLSDYFDINVWNHKVMTTIMNGTPLVKWEDFIENAARQLIVVHTVIHSSKGTNVYINDEMTKRGCSSAKGFTASTFKKFGFEVVRQVCFKFSSGSPIPIYEYNKSILGSFKANNVSIIFTFVPGVDRDRINILEEKYHQGFVDWLKPSKRVINDAKRYIDTFLDASYGTNQRQVQCYTRLARVQHACDTRSTRMSHALNIINKTRVHACKRKACTRLQTRVSLQPYMQAH